MKDFNEAARKDLGVGPPTSCSARSSRVRIRRGPWPEVFERSASGRAPLDDPQKTFVRRILPQGVLYRPDFGRNRR